MLPWSRPCRLSSHQSEDQQNINQPDLRPPDPKARRSRSHSARRHLASGWAFVRLFCHPEASQQPLPKPLAETTRKLIPPALPPRPKAPWHRVRPPEGVLPRLPVQLTCPKVRSSFQLASLSKDNPAIRPFTGRCNPKALPKVPGPEMPSTSVARSGIQRLYPT